MSPCVRALPSRSRFGGLRALARRAVLRASRPVIRRLLTEIAEVTTVAEARAQSLERQIESLRGDLRLMSTDAFPGPESLRLPPDRRRVVHRAAEPGASGGRAIVSRATGPYLRMLALAAPTFELYARRWDWDLVLSNEPSLAEGRPQSWGKIPLIREALDEYELVWWIDADSMIVDVTKNVLDVLDPHCDLHMVEHTFVWDYGAGPETQRFPNMGCFLLRSSDWSRRLLDELWMREDLVDSHWWENTALLATLGYGTYPARPRRPSEWLDRVQFIDKAWNSLDDLDEATAPVVKHHAGNAPFDERLRRMRDDVWALRETLMRA